MGTTVKATPTPALPLRDRAASATSQSVGAPQVPRRTWWLSRGQPNYRGGLFILLFTQSFIQHVFNWALC